MKNVSESLAGRIGILNLLGSSLREKTGVKFNEGFIPTEDYFNKRKSDIKDISYDDVWKSIHSCGVTKTLIGKFSMALMLKSI